MIARWRFSFSRDTMMPAAMKIASGIVFCVSWSRCGSNTNSDTVTAALADVARRPGPKPPYQAASMMAG